MVCAVSLATNERARICDEFERVGPERPTLCEGWSTRALLAHLLVRERQPWAAPGIVVPVLAPVTEWAMRGYDNVPWGEMVGQLRSGPPVWSPFRIPNVDEMANGIELFVHHEDVRRGEPGWEPRQPDAERDSALWSAVTRMGRRLYRHSPVGIALRRPSGDQHVITTGSGLVTIVGEPAELVLHAFGRDAVRVELEGDAAAVAAVAATPRGI
jgi:uncharacterized protein (TIGR03085 family)